MTALAEARRPPRQFLAHVTARFALRRRLRPADGQKISTRINILYPTVACA